MKGFLKHAWMLKKVLKSVNISIVDWKDHILFKIDNIMELKREFMLKNRLFVESNEINMRERSKAIFLPQLPIFCHPERSKGS